MPEADFKLELMREIDGVSDTDEWLELDSSTFKLVRDQFEHPLLDEVRLVYKGDVIMRFRKKADA